MTPGASMSGLVPSLNAGGRDAMADWLTVSVHGVPSITTFPLERTGTRSRVPSNVSGAPNALPPSDIRLCSVVKAELLYGARKSARVSANLERLSQFFATLESLPFDDAAAEHYGLLRTHLESAGTPIGALDMMIAATALAAGATLVTRNQREFHRVAGLSVETWSA